VRLPTSFWLPARQLDGGADTHRRFHGGWRPPEVSPEVNDPVTPQVSDPVDQLLKLLLTGPLSLSALLDGLGLKASAQFQNTLPSPRFVTAMDKNDRARQAQPQDAALPSDTSRT
jgi:hypothetical protein